MISSISVFYSHNFLKHDTGPGHPERPDRIMACVAALKNCDFVDQLEWKSPRSATEEELKYIHSVQHIKHVKQVCKTSGLLDSDTVVCPESYNIAKQSAGAWLDGVEEVLNMNSAFILSRPPGHHAERNRAMGFCLFSNAALAAYFALKQNGIHKVCIFDWDVHHGNGTQDIIKNNPNIYYISTHQFPFYPGTGFHTDTGQHNNILNIPLIEGTNSIEYLKIFDEIVIPFIQKSDSDILIVSAGFDAHRRDPLASINLETEDFAYMTKKLLKIQPNLLIGLEGGYDLTSLGECCVVIAKALLDDA